MWPGNERGLSLEQATVLGVVGTHITSPQQITRPVECGF